MRRWRHPTSRDGRGVQRPANLVDIVIEGIETELSSNSPPAVRHHTLPSKSLSFPVRVYNATTSIPTQKSFSRFRIVDNGVPNSFWVGCEGPCSLLPRGILVQPGARNCKTPPSAVKNAGASLRCFLLRFGVLPSRGN